MSDNPKLDPSNLMDAELLDIVEKIRDIVFPRETLDLESSDKAVERDLSKLDEIVQVLADYNLCP